MCDRYLVSRSNGGWSVISFALVHSPAPCGRGLRGRGLAPAGANDSRDSVVDGALIGSLARRGAQTPAPNPRPQGAGGWRQPGSQAPPLPPPFPDAPPPRLRYATAAPA